MRINKHIKRLIKALKKYLRGQKINVYIFGVSSLIIQKITNRRTADIDIDISARCNENQKELVKNYIES